MSVPVRYIVLNDAFLLFVYKNFKSICISIGLSENFGVMVDNPKENETLN